MQGAGGVGGLLAVKQGTASYYPSFDGNGNISEYLDSTGAVQAHYEYDAFGNTIASSGAKAADFTHRFSTKPLDEETGLYYYGFRYYDPVTGRWPSRDPIGERGGINLYGMVGNDAIYGVDILGQFNLLDCLCDFTSGLKQAGGEFLGDLSPRSMLEAISSIVDGLAAGDFSVADIASALGQDFADKINRIRYSAEQDGRDVCWLLGYYSPEIAGALTGVGGVGYGGFKLFKKLKNLAEKRKNKTKVRTQHRTSDEGADGIMEDQEIRSDGDTVFTRPAEKPGTPNPDPDGGLGGVAGDEVIEIDVDINEPGVFENDFGDIEIPAPVDISNRNPVRLPKQ